METEKYSFFDRCNFSLIFSVYLETDIHIQYRREGQQGALPFGCMIVHSFSFMLLATSKALANPSSIEICIDKKLL